MNIFICVTSLHVSEAVCIAEQDSKERRNILVVINSTRVSELDYESLHDFFEYTFIGNYKLDTWNKKIPFIPDAVDTALSKAITYLALITIAVVIGSICIISPKSNIFFATHSPILNNCLAWIRKRGWAGLYHFEEGISLYTDEELKSRSSLSKMIFPLSLSSMIANGVVDGVYCMRPEELTNVHPNVKKVRIDFFKNIESVLSAFHTGFRFDNIPHCDNIFVLITQPLVKNKYIESGIYWQKTKSLIRTISEDNHVIVKPHPGEDVTKYETYFTGKDVTVMQDNRYPVELLVWTLIRDRDKSKVAVGSTGLSTALCNLTTVPVTKYSFVKYYGMSKMYDKMEQQYKGCSIEYITDPKSVS